MESSHIVNNVETLANVPFIIAKGAEEFVKYGTPECPGTKFIQFLAMLPFRDFVKQIWEQP